MAVIDFFDLGWALQEEAIAYQMGEETWTYDQSRRLSCQIAHGLLDHSLARESKVAVLAPNSPVGWISVLGIWRAGLTWVPLNPSAHPVEIALLVDQFDVDLIIYHDSLATTLQAVFHEIGRKIPGIPFGEHSASQGLLGWASTRPTTPPSVVKQEEDVVAILPTGGTTGTPKGAMATNRSLSAMVHHQITALPYSPNEHVVNLAAAPMTHTAGILTLQTSARGGTVVIVPRATPANILGAIEQHGVTELFVPPTVIYRLLDVLEDEPRDTSTLRYLLYGAAPMSTEKLRQGIERLGSIFIQVYGQAEAPVGISFLRPEQHRIDGNPVSETRLKSCGRPYPMAQVLILDTTTHEPLPTGESGEICVGGDLVMKGYYRSPEKTSQAIIDGWLHTGDIGHLDEEGYLYVTDRSKDMIISGGFNVYPSEVEQVIWSHDSVEDCAIIGLPHDDWGEQVTAVVQLRPGHEVEAQELIDLCRSRLGSIRAPKQVHFMELPRSINGKVLKKDLRSTMQKLTSAGQGSRR